MEIKKITIKQYKWNIRLTLLFGILVGLFFGAILVYKVEINTINQAFDSLDRCYQEYILVSAPLRTEHSFGFWTNYTGEWENYVVSEEMTKKFYRNGDEIYFDCKIENQVYTQEDVIEKYLCEFLDAGEWNFVDPWVDNGFMINGYVLKRGAKKQLKQEDKTED